MQEALRERAHLCADEIKELVPKKMVSVEIQARPSAKHDSAEGIISGLGNPS